MARPSSPGSIVTASQILRTAGLSLFAGAVLLGFTRRADAATITVTRADDAIGSGDGVTLREAIDAANTDTSVDGSVAGSGADIIVFDPTVFALPQTLTLTSGTLSIGADVTINGPGSQRLTLDANQAGRAFDCHTANTILSGLTITRGKLAGTSALGAGIYADGNLTASDVAVSHCSIDATFAAGAGLAVQHGKTTLSDCTIADNSFYASTNGYGGGIFCEDLAMDRCTVSGNAAGAKQTVGGGGVFLNGTGTVNDCTISGNSIRSHDLLGVGGAGAMLSGGTLTYLTSCTITQNDDLTGAGGGGLYADHASSVVIGSSIVAGNTTTNDANGRDLRGDFLTVGTSLIGVLNGAANISTSSSNQSGTDALPLDPLLGPLQNNAGRTMTHAPLAGSPAIDQGSGLTTLATDQRGAPRVMGPNPDAGAVETFPAPHTFVVDSTADDDDGDFSPLHLSLREALELSNSNPGTETLTFAAGLGTITLSSELSITDNVTITGPGAANLAVSGNDASRIFNIDDGLPASALTVQISGLRLSHGKSPAGKPGGAIVSSENLTLTDCVLSNNSSAGKGGALAAYGAPGNSRALTLQNCTFSSNSAAGRGGGVFTYQCSPLNVTRCTVSGNQSTGRGGGTELSHCAGTIDSCSVTGNTAGDAGGGVSLYKSAFNVLNSTLSGNEAQNAGGAGGGLMLYGPPSTLQNCTLSGNSASQGGGNIALHCTAMATIRNTTIANGSAGAAGGGVQLTAGSLLLQSTIVAGNIHAGAVADDISGTVQTTSNFNLIGVNTGLAGISNAANSNQIGTPAAPIDAGLAMLANNGGATQTHALLAASPAINAGSNPAGLSTDQRGTGFQRMSGSATDVGAFEFGDASAPTAVLGSASQVSEASNPTQYDFTIIFNDNVAVNAATLASSNVRVTGPNSFSQLAQYVGAAPAGNGSPRTATYRLSPPGGTWDFADNGTYSITLLANQVADTSGNFAAGALLGSFAVNIPVPAQPPDPPPAPPLEPPAPPTPGTGGTDTDGDGFSDELEQALGTDFASNASTPFSGAPAGGAEIFELGSGKLKIALNFSGKDSVLASGSIPLAAGAVLAGSTIVFDVGGVIAPMALDAKGRASHSDSTAQFTLTMKSKKVRGSVTPSATFSLRISGVNLESKFSDEGLTTAAVKSKPVTVAVQILYAGKLYRVAAPLKYTSTGSRGKTAAK